MSKLSRRNFFLTTSGIAASMAVGANVVQANETESSGLVTGQPKPLRYKAIPGFLSAEQIEPHHTAHYGGALRGHISADEALQSSIVDDVAMDSNRYGALQRAKASKGNSVLLHELYFDGLSFTTTSPNADIRQAIEKRFGSIDKWSSDFQASAKAAAGWAMLTYHPINGKLYNVVSDEHATGPLWMAVPLVVIDVYEHAFYVDYTNRKAEYIEKFMDFIDWDVVNNRYKVAT
ncbi:MAG: Fe-Mn family superoxide dismutase [Pseudomonadota bacterium]